MERLQVRNFGPIESIDIEIKDINIFIGKTSSGKSTVAKLITIFKSVEFLGNHDLQSFKKLLVDYNIDFEIKSSTFIKYSKKNFYCEYRCDKGEFEVFNPLEKIVRALWPIFDSIDANLSGQESILQTPFLIAAIEDAREGLLSSDSNFGKISSLLEEVNEFRKEYLQLKLSEIGQSKIIHKRAQNLLTTLINELNVYRPLYIPAERIILSMVAESLFGLLRNEVSIAASIKDFGAKFEKARNEVRKSVIKFLGVEFEFEENINFIKLSDGVRIRLEHTSSGYQSVTPLFLVLEYFLNRKELFKNCIVIEEPESNLYPTAQKDLVEYIIAGKLKSEDKLFITTHSPYVLTTIDNLIQAYNVAVREGKSSEEVEKIVPRKFWIDFDKVTCYYFENGSCRSTMDRETMTIGASNIDDVSIQLGKTFDELISLKYN